jgi:uncharacterized membrane-anchored protein
MTTTNALLAAILAVLLGSAVVGLSMYVHQQHVAQQAAEEQAADARMKALVDCHYDLGCWAHAMGYDK